MRDAHRHKIVDSPSLEQFYHDMNRYTTAKYRLVEPYVIELDKWDLQKFDTTLGKLTVWVALDPAVRPPVNDQNHYEWTMTGEFDADEYDEYVEQYRTLVDLESVEEFCEQNPPDDYFLDKLGISDLKAEDDDEIDFENDDPLAVWEAAFLPDWTWEAYEVEERDVEVVVEVDDDGDPVTVCTDLYFGRVKSPNTYGSWEYGSFSAHELRQAGAFRVDEDTGDWP